MHPLLNINSELSDDQLSKKISDIRKILNNTSNPDVQTQAGMILTSLLNLQQDRAMRKLSEDPQLDDKLTSVIDIN